MNILHILCKEKAIQKATEASTCEDEALESIANQSSCTPTFSWRKLGGHGAES
jgi:hypothetical protein